MPAGLERQTRKARTNSNSPGFGAEWAVRLPRAANTGGQQRRDARPTGGWRTALCPLQCATELGRWVRQHGLFALVLWHRAQLLCQPKQRGASLWVCRSSHTRCQRARATRARRLPHQNASLQPLSPPFLGKRQGTAARPGAAKGRRLGGQSAQHLCSFGPLSCQDGLAK